MVIEGRRDAEEFLGGVRRVVEEGLLEVHAYCLMGTHFHLLVRSPRGELSRAMMLVQNLYARWFNRGRRRDGPLWRGRFLSKVVQSEEYWDLLVRYIDHNPVSAGIVTDPGQYELGSARQYSRRREGPPWLCRSVVEGAVRSRLRRRCYDPRDYPAVFGAPLSPSACWMLERHAFARVDPEQAFVDLVAAAPEGVREWMRRKARLADGTAALGVGLLDPDVLLAALETSEREDPDWWIRPGKRRKPGWRALRCALLHQVCGCVLEDVARRVGVGATTAGRHLTEHGDLLDEDPGYARRSSELLARLLGSEYGAAR
jgi:REP element-mobilizing transposase RayT